jgi:GNAT superfamily N-acetyltransferase
MDAGIRVRPYEARDYDDVVPLWQAGFAELAPHAWRKATSSPLPFLVFALPAAIAAARGRRYLAGALLAAGAGVYSPAGLWLTQALMWQTIRLQTPRSMSRAKLDGEWSEAGSSGKGAFWTAVDGEGRIVGCVGAKAAHALAGERVSGVADVPGEASVWRLTVAPHARRTGTGQALMATAEGWAAAAGAHHVSLVCGSPPAQAFYRRLGYGQESEGRARAVVFGSPEGEPQGWGALKLRMLRRRVGTNKTIFVKRLLQ